MFLIPTQILQTVVNYLTRRPFNEVHDLIDILTNLKQMDPPEKKEESKNDMEQN
jgi:hypothetical protein